MSSVSRPKVRDEHAPVADLPPRALTVAEVAEAASMSRNGIYLKIRSGELPAVRHGRAIRVRREDFERWMQPSAR